MSDRCCADVSRTQSDPRNSTYRAGCAPGMLPTGSVWVSVMTKAEGQRQLSPDMECVLPVPRGRCYPRPRGHGPLGAPALRVVAPPHTGGQPGRLALETTSPTVLGPQG